jgi:hypothetical protein
LTVLSCNDDRIEIIDIKAKTINFSFNNLPSHFNLIIPIVKQKSIYILNDWYRETNTLTKLDIDVVKIRDIFIFC